MVRWSVHCYIVLLRLLLPVLLVKIKMTNSHSSDYTALGSKVRVKQLLHILPEKTNNPRTNLCLFTLYAIHYSSKEYKILKYLVPINKSYYKYHIVCK